MYINRSIKQFVGYRPKGVACMPATPVVEEGTLWYPLYLGVLALIVCCKARPNCRGYSPPWNVNHEGGEITLDKTLLEPDVGNKISAVKVDFLNDCDCFRLQWTTATECGKIFSDKKLHGYEAEFMDLVDKVLIEETCGNDDKYLFFKSEARGLRTKLLICKRSWVWWRYEEPAEHGDERELTCSFETGDYTFETVQPLFREMRYQWDKHMAKQRGPEPLWYPLSSDLEYYLPEILPRPFLIAIYMSHHTRLGSKSLLRLLDKNLILEEILVHLVPQTTLEMGTFFHGRCAEEHTSGVTTNDRTAKIRLEEQLELHRLDGAREAELLLQAAV